MRYTTIIESFSGEYRWLSNFWIYDTRNNLSVEHKYQAAKTTNYNDWYAILHASTPGNAKRLGKTITIRKDWDSVKLAVMEELSRDKFIYNLSLRDKLLETRGALLIEGNTWGDTFWGVCNGGGENHFGKILMRIRDDFFKDE